jgi:putative peptidoglycan lipid II flippase
VPALSPAMFNVAAIAGAFTLVPLMPALGQPPIMAMALAALVGGFGQIAIQWPALRREGFRYQPIFNPRDPVLRRTLILMGPGTIGLAATQVNLFVNTLLAHEPGNGRRVVADVCVPPDVLADRALRRVDWNRRAAGGLTSRGGE